MCLAVTRSFSSTRIAIGAVSGPSEIIPINFDERTLVFRQIIVEKYRADRARRGTRPAIDTSLGINVQLLCLFKGGISIDIRIRMDAVYRADLDTTLVFTIPAQIGNYVGHLWVPSIHHSNNTTVPGFAPLNQCLVSDKIKRNRPTERRVSSQRGLEGNTKDSRSEQPS